MPDTEVTPEGITLPSFTKADALTWYNEVQAAFGEFGDNDEEHDLLSHMLDQVGAAIGVDSTTYCDECGFPPGEHHEECDQYADEGDLDELREKRDQLMAQLEAQGGRGVELAEEIDALNETIEQLESRDDG